jgi:cytochrome P450
MYRVIECIIQDRKDSPAPEREDDLLGVLLRLQREGGLQFELTNEILSTVIFVRSPALNSSNAYYTSLHFLFSNFL